MDQFIAPSVATLTDEIVTRNPAGCHIDSDLASVLKPELPRYAPYLAYPFTYPITSTILAVSLKPFRKYEDSN